MSRRQDRDAGNGSIVEGMNDPGGTLVVGGDPSQKGVTFAEGDTSLVSGLDLACSLLSLPNAAAKARTLWDWSRVAAKTGAVVAKLAGDKKAAALLGAASNLKTPGKLFDKITQAVSLTKGAGALVP